MEKVVLQANRREIIGKQVKVLRREGKLPAVIYGHHTDPLPILLDTRDASKLLSSIAPSTLITVEVDGKTYPCLVREKQRNKILGTLIHIDFLAVSMEEKLRASVAISLVGVAPAVEEYNGIVIAETNTIEVECLPQDLPEVLEVDISGMSEVGDTIYLRDLMISDRIKILDDLETVVVSVIAQVQEEEEEEEIVEEISEIEPEVIERGRREEEEE